MPDNWYLTETSFEPERQPQKETLFTIGNGYLGTRGSFEEGYPGEEAATLIHGVFDDIPIVFTELANTPNWVHFELHVNGEPFRLDQGRVLSYRRQLDFRNGLLKRQVRWQSPRGDTVELEIERFANLADQHLLAIRYQVTALDFSGQLEFRGGLPGHVDNEGWVHWNWLEQGLSGPQETFLLLETRATQIRLCETCSLNVDGGSEKVYDYWDTKFSPELIARMHVEEGDVVVAEKLVAVYTSRDVDDPVKAALEKLSRAKELGYLPLRAANDRAWAQEWQYCDVNIDGDDVADRALRYSLFQLLIAAPRQDERASIAAKTLSGYGYRGHVFWDTEIFVLPFFTYSRPSLARNLLMYRYHTLAGARRKAQGSGYTGAMYAWESAATGDETTPRWVPRPDGELVRIWCGDIEHHISADVAYAVMRYWHQTGDDDFMRDYGAEIVLDTARFWSGRVEWNEERGIYEITDVIGPDEYHEHVDNNAYTNHMARRNLQAALEVLAWLRSEMPSKAAELEYRLDLNPDRLSHWQHVIRNLNLGYDPDSGLIEQFEGFYKRRHVDLQYYEPRRISMQALLGIEGVQDYQIIKQPDVLMLLYLLDSDYESQVLTANLEFYTPRTDLTYGSSLGPAIQALLAARSGDIQAAYRHFMHAARTDLEDARGNTADGFHAATAGGLWQAAIFGFGGLKVNGSQPEAHPKLPPGWKRLKFRIHYRGDWYEFDLNPQAGSATAGGQAPVVEGCRITLPKCELCGAIFDLDGVLTDTSELHYQAWKKLADEEGIAFSRADNEALRGVSRRESLLLLLKDRVVSEESMQEMMARKNHYYQESISQLGAEDLLPGAYKFLEDLRAAGIKIAIGSASKNARMVIEKLGIGPLVDAISDGFSVTRQKPAPDLFLHAAAQLGLPPQQCVVFEDAEAGVQAALSGGLRVVGIGPEGRVGSAEIVLPGLDMVHWESLCHQLSGLKEVDAAE